MKKSAHMTIIMVSSIVAIGAALTNFVWYKLTIETPNEVTVVDAVRAAGYEPLQLEDQMPGRYGSNDRYRSCRGNPGVTVRAFDARRHRVTIHICCASKHRCEMVW